MGRLFFYRLITGAILLCFLLWWFPSLWGGKTRFVPLGSLDNANMSNQGNVDGPVAYWNFEENDDKVIADASGHGNKGTSSGDFPKRVSGYEGKALSFDAENNHVRIPPAILDGAKAFTVMAWINMESYAPKSQSSILVDRTTTSADFQFVVLPDDFQPHKLMLNVWSQKGEPASAVSELDIPLHAWTHVAGVYDGNQISVYINGVKAGANNFSGELNASSNDFRIGGSVYGAPGFHGLIDEVKIFNRGLSDEEIIRQGKLQNIVSAAADRVELEPGLKKGSVGFWAGGPDGKPLPRMESAYVTDVDYTPLASANKKGSYLVFNNLPGKPFMLHSHIDVPGFGKLDFSAGNGGEGYQADGQTLNLLYEVANHRYLSVHKVLDAAQGFAFPNEVVTGLLIAKALLDEAATYPVNSKERSSLSLKSLKYSAPAGETVVLERGRQKLDRQKGLRKGTLISTFSLYEQREGKAWLDAMSPLFNSGVQFWHWAINMPEDGKFDWTFVGHSLDETVNKFAKRGKTVRGHTLLWLSPLPEWYTSKYATHPYPKTFEETKKIALAFTKAIGTRYPNIKYWNITNELNNSWSNMGFLEPEQMVELTGIVSKELGQINKSAVRGINSVMMWGEDGAGNLNKKPRVAAPYEFFKMLNNARVPYEYIGMQLYFHGRDLFEIDQMLERYKLLGKRIHVTETGTASDNEPQKNSKSFADGHPGQKIYTWHRPWDEDLQADWLEGMFIVSLSKDYVDEWNWWDLAEYEDNYYPWGGLMDKHYQPKPSYKRLEKLMRQWGAEVLRN